MFITILLRKAREWLLYYETVRELGRLSDRQLADVGIGRHDIREIARQDTH